MENLVKGLIGLAVLAFVLAVVNDLTGILLMVTTAEAASRASNNIALIAIALTLMNKRGWEPR